MISKLAWEAQPTIFVGLILLQVIQGLFPVVAAWITKQIFDYLLLPDGDESVILQAILPFLFLYTGINLFAQFLNHVMTLLNAEMGRKLHLTSQTMLYNQLNKQHGLAYFEDARFHSTFEMASYGLLRGPSEILQVVTGVVFNLLTIFSFIGVLLLLSPTLAVLVMVATIPHVMVQLKLGRQRFQMMHMNTPKDRKAGYFGQLLSRAHFAKELRLFNLGPYFLKQFLDLTAEIQLAQRKQQLREIRWQLGVGIILSAASGITFFIVIMEAIKGKITIGDVTLYISAAASVQSSLLSLSYSFGNLNENVALFKRFNEFMLLPPSILNAASPRDITALESAIELRGVSFRYTDNHPWVLNDINLVLPKGKCVALVGLNGAGKTTLVKLLTRLYDPTEGQILWDGVDIREYDIQDLRKHMSVIFQDFVRYDLSVEENIGLGNIDEFTNLERIKAAAIVATANGFIEELPNSYKTILSRWIEEDGIGADLSTGQWQRIAIARLLMRDANFIILDEPTASLDATSEHELYKHFTNLVESRTSLLISHRFSTLKMADLIAVLENGTITEYGTHQQLLAQNNTYARLYEMHIETSI